MKRGVSMQKTSEITFKYNKGREDNFVLFGGNTIESLEGIPIIHLGIQDDREIKRLTTQSLQEYLNVLDCLFRGVHNMYGTLLGSIKLTNVNKASNIENLSTKNPLSSDNRGLKESVCIFNIDDVLKQKSFNTGYFKGVGVSAGTSKVFRTEHLRAASLSMSLAVNNALGTWGSEYSYRISNDGPNIFLELYFRGERVEPDEVKDDGICLLNCMLELLFQEYMNDSCSDTLALGRFCTFFIDNNCGVDGRILNLILYIAYILYRKNVLVFTYNRGTPCWGDYTTEIFGEVPKGCNFKGSSESWRTELPKMYVQCLNLRNHRLEEAKNQI